MKKELVISELDGTIDVLKDSIKRMREHIESTKDIDVKIAYERAITYITIDIKYIEHRKESINKYE